MRKIPPRRHGYLTAFGSVLVAWIALSIAIVVCIRHAPTPVCRCP